MIHKNITATIFVIVPFNILLLLSYFKSSHEWALFFIVLAIAGLAAGYYTGKAVLIGWLMGSVICVIEYQIITPNDPQKSVGYLIFPIVNILYAFTGLIGSYIKEKQIARKSV